MYFSDFGAELLSKVLQIIKPDRNVCFQSDSIIEIIQSYSETVPVSFLTNPLTYDYHALRKDSVATRSLAIASYFAQLPTEDSPSSLRGVIPYVIPWWRVKLSIVHGSVPPDHVVSLLIGNVVALCKTNDDWCEETEHWLQNPEYPQLCREDCLLSECFGFGNACVDK